jgi:predicted dinucleotide-binding enzyme
MSTIEGLKDLLQGKILIDVTVPWPAESVQSATAAIRFLRRRGTDAAGRAGTGRFGVLQNVSAHKLKKLDHKIECDVLVTSDDKTARLWMDRFIGRAGCWQPRSKENEQTSWLGVRPEPERSRPRDEWN